MLAATWALVVPRVEAASTTVTRASAYSFASVPVARRCVTRVLGLPRHLRPEEAELMKASLAAAMSSASAMPVARAQSCAAR